MRVAAVQSDCVCGNPTANRELLAARLETVSRERPDLIVMPELAFTGLVWDQVEELAETLDGPTIRMVADAARRIGAFIVPGSLWERTEDGVYNTTVVVNPAGDVCAAYRKIYLFRPMGEHTVTRPGRQAVWFEMAGFGRIGLAICYDIRFPELFRALVRHGCTAFIVPAAFPDIRIEHWVTLARARAIENQSFVIAVNRSGMDGDVRFGGRSLVVSPDGQILAAADASEETLIVDCADVFVNKVRMSLPALQDMAEGPFQ